MIILHQLDKPMGHEEQPLNPEELRKALDNLQGNILKGHGRNHSIHIFLHFKDAKETQDEKIKDKVKIWIGELAKRITSAQQQLDETEQYKKYRIPGRLFMSFLLSAKGYEYLHLPLPNPSHAFHTAFSEGMQNAQERLNDPLPAKWDEGYRKEIHAMVLLADNDEPYLLREARNLFDDVRQYADICAVEHGRAMRNAHGESVEHFGYADGRNQPLFFQRDVEQERQNKDGTSVWDPSAGPDLVLVRDPYGRESDSGSYLVFRKLEQHVRAFKEREIELAQALGLTGEDVERAGALVMGRFKDGTPVIFQRAPGSTPIPNNFTYADDPHGQKCPFQAHIRKVNPRQQGIIYPGIVRRGITYGERIKEPKDNPSLEELPLAGVGLLFMCYQRDIRRQFELLQGRWANDPRLPQGQEPGIDPIIGQHGVMGTGEQKWPAQWGDPREKHTSFAFHGFVTLKGGEYFFAPSIYFLSNMG
jgi:Dyp-type peroxidase family